MTDVCAAVSPACGRAGLADTGTHRFRHRLGTDMLAEGARLEEIGQVLRHRHLETTAMYVNPSGSGRGRPPLAREPIVTGPGRSS